MLGSWRSRLGSRARGRCCSSTALAAADEAERELSAAQSLVDEMGAVAYAPRVLLARAELAQARGDTAACERERKEAHRLFVAMGATGYAERLAKELAP